ncbi:unnamed protein product, partial [Dracunculus medinensis]|uniref:SHL2A protein n=1 Tax=Dracunculus medinensis TaxID=318479 RepID=A0A0N4U657_DRAME
TGASSVLLGFFVLFHFGFCEKKDGGSSISGISVTCYSNLKECQNGCRFSCYLVDHCNDSKSPMVACAPGLVAILLITFVFILAVAFTCCLVCIFTPVCCFYKWWRKKRNKNRTRARV